MHRLVAELDALIAADLTHPAVAAPIATGVAGVTAYLAQDFVAADSLDTVLRERRTSRPCEVLRVISQVADALDVAAAGRIVHGALHPRDVLVSPDDVRVTGLGVARALERIGVAAPIRRPYTAPERVGSRAWDRRADVFSLGVLAFEMLWGRRPSAAGARAADELGDLPGADLAALRAVMSRALAETFTERFDTAERFVDALREALGEAAGQEEPLTLPSGRTAMPAPSVDGERDRGRFEVDQFRAVEAEQPFLPAPVLSFGLGDALAARVADAGAPVTPTGLALAAETESVAPVALDPVVASATSDPIPPDAPQRPPKKAVRRDRLAPSDARGIRAEGALFEPQVGAAAVETPFAGVDRAGSAVWPLVMALGVGLAVGFAGGYGLGGGQRGQSPPPAAVSAVTPAAAPAPPPPAPPAIATEPASVARPIEPTGAPEPARESATVAARPPGAAGPRPTAVPSPTSRRPAATRPPPAPTPPELATATLIVDSRPAGARVLVDGRLIGTTPLLLPGVATGDHAVRIELAGYNAWASSVRLVGGERRRVAASLER